MSLSITKLQNLKAIHNCRRLDSMPLCVVINRKTTKFENNSQRRLRRYTQSLMLSITKLQNLRAIHNITSLLMLNGLDVINHKTTKFESNSQLIFPRHSHLKIT